MKKNAKSYVGRKHASTESLPTAQSSSWKRSTIVPIYSCRLTVGVFPDNEQLIEAAKKVLPKKEAWAHCGAMSLYDGHGSFYVFFIREGRLINSNTIAHECLHATNRIAEGCGWGLCNETSEPFAYLNGWISAFVIKALADHGESIHG